jgi:transposase-like protein
MKSRHSVEEKFEIGMEALTENTTQADICRRHGIFPTQFAKLKEQITKSKQCPYIFCALNRSTSLEGNPSLDNS